MIYYCAECGKERNWTVNTKTSFDQCEVCGDITECYQVTKEEVVQDVDVKAVLEAMKTIMNLHSQGFETVSDTKEVVTLKKGSVTITVAVPVQEVINGK